MQAALNAILYLTVIAVTGVCSSAGKASPRPFRRAGRCRSSLHQQVEMAEFSGKALAPVSCVLSIDDREQL